MKKIAVAISLLISLSGGAQKKDTTGKQDTVWIAQMPADLYYSLVQDLVMQTSGKTKGITDDEWKSLLNRLQSSSGVFPYVPNKELPKNNKK